MTKILIADDCKELLFAMKLFLESKGYSIETVSKSKKIIKKIQEFNPNLLITDVFMKGKDGLQLTREIRNSGNFKSLKIMVFSSSPGALENFKEAGADAAIEKPFELFDLEKKIQQTLALPINLEIIKGASLQNAEQTYKISSLS